MMRRCRYCKQHNIAKDAPKTDAFCSHEHKVAYAMDQVNKLRQRRAKLEKQETVRRKKEFYANDLSHQKALTQTVCNKLVSLLDAGRTCISCGRPLRGGRFQHASHLKSVGSNSFLRYCLINIHLACVNCNQHQSGNIEGYKVGIVERYGRSMLEYLESAPRVKTWECDELIALRKELNTEIARVEKGLPPSRDWRALPQTEQMRGAA